MIPNWVFDVTNKDFINSTDKLAELQKWCEDQDYPGPVAEALTEIDFLQSVTTEAISKLYHNIILKEAANTENKTNKPATDAPAENTTTVVDQPTQPVPKKVEPKISKWKEVRFNEKAGVWQVIVTQRNVRNFNDEDEAYNFLKLAKLANGVGPALAKFINENKENLNSLIENIVAAVNQQPVPLREDALFEFIDDYYIEDIMAKLDAFNETHSGVLPNFDSNYNTYLSDLFQFIVDSVKKDVKK